MYNKRDDQEVSMVTITDDALAHAVALKKKLNKPDDYVLNVKLNAGGCSGFMYEIEFIEPPPEKTHRLFDYGGLSVTCDKKSYLFLIGTEIDWEETLMSTGFKFNTPSATGKCGCGESVAF